MPGLLRLSPELAQYVVHGFLLVKRSHGTSPDLFWGRLNKGVCARSIVHWVPSVEANYTIVQGVKATGAARSLFSRLNVPVEVVQCVPCVQCVQVEFYVENKDNSHPYVFCACEIHLTLSMPLEPSLHSRPPCYC